MTPERKIVTRETLARARRIIEQSVATHKNWLCYIEGGGREGIKHAGDATHHRQALEDYAYVLGVLDALPDHAEELLAAQEERDRLTKALRDIGTDCRIPVAAGQDCTIERAYDDWCGGCVARAALGDSA